MSIPDEDLLTIAAAILEAGDRAARACPETARMYLERAAELQDEARDVVADRLASFRLTKGLSP